MKLRKFLAVAVAAAFALPLAAQSADNDRLILAQAGGPSGASSVGTGPTGGTNSPQSAGEPKAAAGEHSSTATKRCEGMVGMERDNCMRDARAAGTAGSTTGTTGSATGGATTAPAAPSGAVVSPSGSGTTGATAGPGSASNRTAPSSDTATSPSTSGQGKAK